MKHNWNMALILITAGNGRESQLYEMFMHRSAHKLRDGWGIIPSKTCPWLRHRNLGLSTSGHSSIWLTIYDNLLGCYLYFIICLFHSGGSLKGHVFQNQKGSLERIVLTHTVTMHHKFRPLNTRQLLVHCCLVVYWHTWRLVPKLVIFFCRDRTRLLLIKA